MRLRSFEAFEALLAVFGTKAAITPFFPGLLSRLCQVLRAADDPRTTTLTILRLATRLIQVRIVIITY